MTPSARVLPHRVLLFNCIALTTLSGPVHLMHTHTHTTGFTYWATPRLQSATNVTQYVKLKQHIYSYIYRDTYIERKRYRYIEIYIDIVVHDVEHHIH